MVYNIMYHDLKKIITYSEYLIFNNVIIYINKSDEELHLVTIFIQRNGHYWQLEHSIPVYTKL